MAKETNIAAQVAAMSREKQDKILKIGRISSLMQLSVGIPWVILAVIGLWMMISPPAGFDYNDYDRLYVALLIWLAVGAAYVLGVFIFVLVKFPCYSDAKYKYIRKMRAR